MTNSRMDWGQTVVIRFSCSLCVSGDIIGCNGRLSEWPTQQQAWRRLSKHELFLFLWHLYQVFPIQFSGPQEKRGNFVLSDSKSGEWKKIKMLVHKGMHVQDNVCKEGGPWVCLGIRVQVIIQIKDFRKMKKRLSNAEAKSRQWEVGRNTSILFPKDKDQFVLMSVPSCLPQY